MLNEFTDRVCVITGAASGIGFALAEKAAAEGMKIVMADVERDRLDVAVEKIRAAGAEVFGMVTDVANESEVEALAKRSQEAFGAVHLLCNNAGVITGGATWEAPRSDWDWVLGVNVHGVLHGIRAFVPQMIERREGHVVNVASMAGLVSMPFSSVYCVSKHAVVALSECLALELDATGSGVGCTVLCPEGVNTAINRAHRNRPTQLQRDESGAPMGEQAVLAGLDDLVEDGVPPARMAERVFDAVRAGRFYALPPPGNPWREACHARLDQIREERNPSLSIGEA